jgi:diacylglycerol kinase (ATP)
VERAEPGWSSLAEGAVVAIATVRLARRGRWRAAATVLSAWAGAGLAARAGRGGGRAAGVGAAYGLGRIAPPWRIPLLAGSGALQARQGRPTTADVLATGRKWLTSLAGTMAAVAIAEWLADRRPRQISGRQVAVVVNTGSGSPHLARRALRTLRRQPVEVVEVHRTTGSGLVEALEQALASLGPDGVLAVAGGDGTVGLAAAAARRARRTLAILPTGTGNDIARSLGLPLTPEEAAALITDAVPRPIDLGNTDSGSFAHVASVGMTADFAQRIRHVRGWRRPLVYPIRAWQAWRTRRPLAVEVVVDGRPLTTPNPPYQVAIVNAPRLGGRIGVRLPGSAVDDGLIDAVVSYRSALRQSVRTLTHLLQAGTDRHWPGAVVGTGEVIEIRGSTLPLSLDGEPTGRTPVRADVLPHECQVIGGRNDSGVKLFRRARNRGAVAGEGERTTRLRDV